MMELRVRQKGQLQRERDKASLREAPKQLHLSFIRRSYSRGVPSPQCVPWINRQLEVRILTLRLADARRGLSVKSEVCSQISTVRINIMIKMSKNRNPSPPEYIPEKSWLLSVPHMGKLVISRAFGSRSADSGTGVCQPESPQWISSSATEGG